MDNKDVVMIVFSKNRALQLDLCLNGFYKACSDVDLPIIKVIYKVDENHRNSYETLKKEHEYPEFIEETNFKENVLEALKDKRFVLWCVDDTIWVNNFSIEEITRLLQDEPGVIGFSFRLGQNCIKCYPYNADQPVPEFYPTNNPKIKTFYWPISAYDFCYALEVSSSLYRIEDLKPILEAYLFRNPNDLESLLYYNLDKFLHKPSVACYETSVAFANPANRVQSVALANRFSGKNSYTSDNLLEMYERDYRVDYNRYYGMVSDGAHMEVPLGLVNIEFDEL